MQYFKGTAGTIYTIRINPDEDLLGSIEKFVEETGLKHGVIVTGIATIKNCELHMVTTTTYPPVNYYDHMPNEPLELSALSGVIADGDIHMHMVVSNRKVAYSGHVEHGCTVLYLCEVVIMEIPDGNFRHALDENNVKQLEPM